MDKHYILPKEKAKIYYEERGLHYLNKTVVLNEKQVKELITENKLDYLREVKHNFDVGDYITCIKPLPRSEFDISDYCRSSLHIDKFAGCWKEGLTFRVRKNNRGLALFPDRFISRISGVFANCVREATKEEIKEFNKRYEKEILIADQEDIFQEIPFHF